MGSVLPGNASDVPGSLPAGEDWHALFRMGKKMDALVKQVPLPAETS